MFDTIRHDIGRCGDGRHAQLREILFNSGMWAVISYRFRRWIYTCRAPRIVKLPLNVVSTLMQLWTTVLTNIEIPASVEIGPGLYIAHTGYIVVGSGAVIGRNCTLTQGVTIGHAGGGTRARRGCPIVGDRVYIGPGAAIIGPIQVGDDALVGVGAVVVRSVPDRAVVVGNPARIISCRGSFDLIEYPGMDDDPARMAALVEVDGPYNANLDADGDVDPPNLCRRLR